MLSIHVAGDWAPEQVEGGSVASSRLIVPEVERLIDIEWAKMTAAGECLLFDGAMCRFEAWNATPTRLKLSFSQTSYKPFLGTNLTHPELSDRYGRRVLANPAGVSPAVLTHDEFLIFGRRNESVAYYPGRTHPFAGAMEPRDATNVFAAVTRELAEELALAEADLMELRCTGVAQDWNLRQDELIFRVTTRLTLAELERKLDREEHHASWSIPATRQSIERALPDPQLTPVSVAALLLWGATRWGPGWMRQNLLALGGKPPANSGAAAVFSL